ncbi:hypothetical protein [Cohnella abietis]|uniref:Uncharacterized protein n=1 Tax=Cohnella abietis TaxID=2507935 RepID=A0A3T1D2C5_9BACL|nr:hypothetical protein [Cohnella abietis]BBI32267.1 hypothetical protein KCTCHS21_16660 [Cohnella abietis]
MKIENLGRLLLTTFIFNDADVIYQLSQAEKDRQEAISTYSDNEEEFAVLLSEIIHKK